MSKAAAKQALVAWYQANMGKSVRLGRYTVKVTSFSTDNRYGSWERGFKFSTTTYGVLARRPKDSFMVFSMDHGATWHSTVKEARKGKGKIKLTAKTTTEFAFNDIQEINRRWDGPNYKWKP